MPDDMRPFDAECIHQLDDVGRHAVDGIGDAAVIALTDAAMIVSDHVVPLGENRDLITPKGAEPAKTRDENDGEAGALALVEKLTIADRDARHVLLTRPEMMALRRYQRPNAPVKRAAIRAGMRSKRPQEPRGAKDVHSRRSEAQISPRRLL